MIEEGSFKSSSSDSLIDIQIEESLNRESLMAIDSANLKEDIYTIFGFVLVLVLAVLIGIFGPKAAGEYSSSWKFFPDSSNNTLSFPITGISTLQRSISLQIKFEKIRLSKITEKEIIIEYSIEFKKNQQKIKQYSKEKQNILLSFDKHKQFSQPIVLYSTSLIDFDFCNVKLNAEKLSNDILSETVSIIYGNEQHTIFQIYFRLICSGFSIVLFITLLIRLSKISPKLWHLEQQLTIPLLILSFLMINPLFIIHMYFPFELFIYIDHIFSAIFNAYFYFFILTLFDSLRYKNRKTDKYFFVPKIILFILYLCILFIESFSHQDQLLDEPFLPRFSKEESILNWVQIGSEMVFIGFIILSIIRAALQIDITERYKFNMYIMSTITAITAILLCDFVFKAFRVGMSYSISFIAKFVVKSIYVMLMAYFHWPYEVLNDQVYDNKSENILEDEAFTV